jgi:hypothetical protein
LILNLSISQEQVKLNLLPTLIPYIPMHGRTFMLNLSRFAYLFKLCHVGIEPEFAAGLSKSS